MRTVNLELSKQLLKLGWKGATYFIWDIGRNYHRSDINIDITANDLTPEVISWIDFVKRNNYKEKDAKKYVIYPSPTADEILEQLPKDILIANNDGYTILSGDIKSERGTWKDSSLSDCAAKCWLYLKQNGLLEEV